MRCPDNQSRAALPEAANQTAGKGKGGNGKDMWLRLLPLAADLLSTLSSRGFRWSSASQTHIHAQHALSRLHWRSQTCFPRPQLGNVNDTSNIVEACERFSEPRFAISSTVRLRRPSRTFLPCLVRNQTELGVAIFASFSRLRDCILPYRRSAIVIAVAIWGLLAGEQCLS